MVLIGVDPHKMTHTAVAIDGDETPIARVQVDADGRQIARLLAWAEPLGNERVWAIESAAGLGQLLSQQLVAAGEVVVDVPAALSARARLLGSTKAAKNDPNDALSAAIVALRNRDLRVVGADGHNAVLRLLADRLHDLTASRTQTACRLHVVLRELIEGGAPLRLRADRAAKLLRSTRPTTAVDVERRRLGLELVADLRRCDLAITEQKTRIITAVAVTGTALLEIHGVGPTVAAIILGQVGDPARFPSRDRFAAYNGTAPIEASTAMVKRHRVNQRGNRRLNHALHLIAVTQVAHDTPGRAYYQRKLDEGKSKKEALRALKRRISDAVWRQLQVDLDRR